MKSSRAAILTLLTVGSMALALPSRGNAVMQTDAVITVEVHPSSMDESKEQIDRIDLGRLKSDERRNVTTQLFNRQATAIEIAEVVVSCAGCVRLLTPEVVGATILPGSAMTLHFEVLTSGKQGRFEQWAAVMSSDGRLLLRLAIAAEIASEWAFPPMVHFGRVRAGVTQTRVVYIYGDAGSNSAIEAVAGTGFCSASQLHILPPLDPGGRHVADESVKLLGRVVIDWTPGDDESRFLAGSLKIHMRDGSDDRTIRVPVEAQVIGVWAPRPAALYFGTCRVGRTTTRHLEFVLGSDVVLLEECRPVSTDARVTARITKAADGRLSVECSFTPVIGDSGVLLGEICVWVGHLERARVPFSAFVHP